jgi:hypothetical protein
MLLPVALFQDSPVQRAIKSPFLPQFQGKKNLLSGEVDF